MPAPGTEMQARFAMAYAANGGDHVRAAIEAGYSEHSAKDLGYRNLQNPFVQEMIMLELSRQKARAGAVGLNALVTVADSDKAPAAARVAAGRALMEFADMIGSGKSVDEPIGAGRGESAPNYKDILDAFANISSLAVAAQKETLQ